MANSSSEALSGDHRKQRQPWKANVKVIYVDSLHGNDVNDGMNPQTAVKTPEQARKIYNKMYRKCPGIKELDRDTRIAMTTPYCGDPHCGSCGKVNQRKVCPGAGCTAFIALRANSCKQCGWKMTPQQILESTRKKFDPPKRLHGAGFTAHLQYIGAAMNSLVEHFGGHAILYVRASKTAKGKDTNTKEVVMSARTNSFPLTDDHRVIRPHPDRELDVSLTPEQRRRTQHMRSLWGALDTISRCLKEMDDPSESGGMQHSSEDLPPAPEPATKRSKMDNAQPSHHIPAPSHAMSSDPPPTVQLHQQPSHSHHHYVPPPVMMHQASMMPNSYLSASNYATGHMQTPPNPAPLPSSASFVHYGDEPGQYGTHGHYLDSSITPSVIGVNGQPVHLPPPNADLMSSDTSRRHQTMMPASSEADSPPPQQALDLHLHPPSNEHFSSALNHEP